MLKRLLATMLITALLAPGCGKKKQDNPAAAGSATPGDTVNPPTATGNDLDVHAVVAAAADAATLGGGRAKGVTGQLIDALDAAQQAVSRDAWDPAAVVAAVGKDRVALFTWVRDHTALVPYRGSLRGPVGVMMDRLGNSFDRALLLAELLKQAGLEVRLANAQLEPASVDKLVTSYRTRARPAVPSAGLDEAALLAKIAPMLGVDPGALKAKLAAQQTAIDAVTTRTKTRVLEQTRAISAMVPPTGTPANETAAFVDHWWVQIHDGDLWSDLDPSLPAAAPGEALATSATETLVPSDLADDRRHTMTVRVIGEVWHDDVREEAKLLDHTFAPNQFYGQRIVLQTVPLDMPQFKEILAAPDRAAFQRKALLSQVEFAPILSVGNSAVAGFSVTERGELTNLTAGDGNTIRLARAVQHATKDGVGGATDMLGELPGGSDMPAGSAKPHVARQAFTAEWLEIEIHTPGQPSRITRRTIFDTSGDARDRAAAPRAPLADAAKLDRDFAMMGEIELLPMFAQVPRAYIERLTTRALISAREIIAALAMHQDVTSLLDKADGLIPLPGPLYTLAASRFLFGPQVYLDRLDVLSMRDRFALKGNVATARRDVDILANGVAVWPSEKDPRAARIAQGIVDTALEGVTVGCPGDIPCTRTPSTSELYAGANAKGWSLVTDPHGPAAADRDAGYAIVAASATPSSWWRIDPATGETLGMNPLGGNAATEEALKQIALGLNFISGVHSLIKCVYQAASGTINDMGGGVRCVGAASLNFAGNQVGIVYGGAVGGLLMAWLLNQIATAVS